MADALPWDPEKTYDTADELVSFEGKSYKQQQWSTNKRPDIYSGIGMPWVIAAAHPSAKEAS
ncbi:carbohydrate-binding protein [Streptomyces atratus]|uniref:carbohydrate-binding protein n=1 Tax=Streptomyces atratus TaxID=1893 RepID=UPI0036697225